MNRLNSMKTVFQYILLLLCVAVIPAYARVRTVQSVRDFDQQLSKSNLMTVLFYNGGEKQDRRNTQEQMRSFFNMYESVSSKKLYDDADVVFIKLNISNPAMKQVADRYAISNVPVFILFIKSNPVIDRNKNIARLGGFVSEKELQDFINHYYSNTMKTMVKEKEYNRKERYVKSQEESDPYFYPAVYYAPEYDFSWQKPLKYDKQGNETQ